MPGKFRIAYKWEMLTLLWFAFLFNQADRAMFGFVMPLIKADLHLSDVQLGVVASVFHICYGLLAPVAGYAGDVFRRSRVVVASIATWSLATLLTGLSTRMWHLVVFRGASLSFGEAFYLPSANALISQYHSRTRAFAMSIHQTALYCGMIGSGAIAGFLGHRYGWRCPFALFGALGLFWAALMFFRLADPAATHPEAEGGKNRVPLRETAEALFRKKSVLMLCGVFGCLVFVNVGYVTWMPTLLHEKFGLTLAQAGFSSMFYHVVCAFAGVMAGGRFSDRLALRRRDGRLIVAALGFLFCVPFVYLMGNSPSLLFSVIGLGGFGLFRGICDSTFFAGLFDVLEIRYRSSGQGLVISFGLLIGALAPVILGWMKGTLGLSRGIGLMSGVSLLGAVMTGLTLMLFFRKDYVSSPAGTR
ncbi:MAG: MFS transporter [Kiritimatiellia bacterium]|jgi:MFS family permease|nr:MFS transporter [Kiritimatiellia bacterium]